MSDLLTDFKRDCAKADVKPTDALEAGGVHRSLWLKWERGKSPTLKNFEAARRGLETLVARRQSTGREAA